jgi:hypothetical protein
MPLPATPQLIVVLASLALSFSHWKAKVWVLRETIPSRQV